MLPVTTNTNEILVQQHNRTVTELFVVSISAQPISRTDGVSSTRPIALRSCPTEPLLLPLPNIRLNYGSKFSFAARFKWNTVPMPRISWHFSKDRLFCRNPHEVNYTATQLFNVSKNRRILYIEKFHLPSSPNN